MKCCHPGRELGRFLKSKHRADVRNSHRPLGIRPTDEGALSTQTHGRTFNSQKKTHGNQPTAISRTTDCYRAGAGTPPTPTGRPPSPRFPGAASNRREAGQVSSSTGTAPLRRPLLRGPPCGVRPQPPGGSAAEHTRVHLTTRLGGNQTGSTGHATRFHSRRTREHKYLEAAWGPGTHGGGHRHRPGRTANLVRGTHRHANHSECCAHGPRFRPTSAGLRRDNSEASEHPPTPGHPAHLSPPPPPRTTQRDLEFIQICSRLGGVQSGDCHGLTGPCPHSPSHPAMPLLGQRPPAQPCPQTSPAMGGRASPWGHRTLV